MLTRLHPGPGLSCQNTIPQCDVNMALLIEGKENDELPEQVLGAIGIRGWTFSTQEWRNGRTATHVHETVGSIA